LIVSFGLALLALFSVQALSLMFERVPESLSLLRETPLLSPATSLSPMALAVAGGSLMVLFLARLRREPTPLAAGSFINGMGHAGLQVIAMEWLRPYFSNYTVALVGAFAFMAVLGAWRAVRRKNEDDSMALIAYFISTIAAVAFGYFVVSHFGQLDLASAGVLPAGLFICSLPAYFSARACATQVALIRPGGGKALLMVLGLTGFGAICGAVAVAAVAAVAGVVYATVIVAALYLLVAWLFTQGRGSPFAGVMIPSA
jgi:hypothetical protein